ncbi:MAG: hypothetical protein IJZ46_00725 [Bacilli bacterium]|nr:hypothetical protein [Bacilli bacterium]
MDFIIELLLELIFEGGMELSTSKKVPKWLRIIIASIIILFMLTITIGLVLIGILLIKTDLLPSIFFIVIGFVLLIGTILKIKKLYFQKTRKTK